MLRNKSTRSGLKAMAFTFALGLLGASSVSAAKVEVTLWHHWDGGRETLVQQILDAFMAENPDIVAKQMFAPTAGAADKLTTFLVTGTSPEIVMVRSSYAPQMIRMGGLQSLDRLLARDGLSADLFIPGDLANFRDNGATYALPVISGAAWTNLMFYNKRLMAEAGLMAEAPKTWAEWREMSVRMTKRDSSGRILTGGTEMPVPAFMAPWNGVQMWSSDWKKATVNNARMLETMNFLKDLLQAQYGSYEQYTAFNGTGFQNAFFLDKQGFSFRNSSAFAHLQTLDLDWGVGLAPRNQLHADTAPIGLVTSTWAYAIPAGLSGPKLEAAWKLLKWLTLHEQGGGLFARAQGRPSPVIKFNHHPDYRRTNPYWNTVIESIQYTVAAPPVNIEVTTSPLVQFLTGKSHPQQALADAELALQLQLDALWRK